jgi:hypothetical protein
MQRQDFWSRFHRFFGFSYDPLGFSFNYKGDEIIWLWRWKRGKSKLWKFYSIGFCAKFRSIKQIDELWKEYFESMKGLT